MNPLHVKFPKVRAAVAERSKAANQPDIKFRRSLFMAYLAIYRALTNSVRLIGFLVQLSQTVILMFIIYGPYKTGGPTFGPVKCVKEVSHVKHMHADSLLVHPNFSSKVMIT